jgi:flavin reductase (DIM6/NTAB) family NADH-FMN oxidoreductase RutF
MHDRLITASHFCVNILHQAHRGLAQVFADSKTRDSRFAAGNRDLDAEAPCLTDAQAVPLCDRTEQFRSATHTICVGLVRDIRLPGDVDPLLWVDGRYRKAG